jgi:hypothetical protein
MALTEQHLIAHYQLVSSAHPRHSSAEALYPCSDRAADRANRNLTKMGASGGALTTT